MSIASTRATDRDLKPPTTRKTPTKPFRVIRVQFLRIGSRPSGNSPRSFLVRRVWRPGEIDVEKRKDVGVLLDQLRHGFPHAVAGFRFHTDQKWSAVGVCLKARGKFLRHAR